MQASLVDVFQIRPAALHDLPGAYRACLLTGDSGRDGSGLYRDPDLLGHVYVGPYIVGQPGTELVLTDADGVAGYLLAADDTRAFEAWAATRWWPALRERYPMRSDGTLEAELIGYIHQPPRVPGRWSRPPRRPHDAKPLQSSCPHRSSQRPRIYQERTPDTARPARGLNT